MTDEEVICTKMEPKPLSGVGHLGDCWPFKWWGWTYAPIQVNGVNVYPGGLDGYAYSTALDLKALREVEETLTETQWIHYELELQIVFESDAEKRNQPLPRTERIRRFINASAEQKIKALAAVLREAKHGQV